MDVTRRQDGGNAELDIDPPPDRRTPPRDDTQSRPQKQDKSADDDKDDAKDGKNDKDKTDGDKDKPRSKLPLIILAVVVLLLVVGGVAYWLLTAGQVSTDDAYTEGNAISIAPKVAGYVTELAVNDNTDVKAGQLLLRIDPRDYVAARDQARANLALAEAQLSSARTELAITRIRAPAQQTQAQAQVEQAQAAQNNAQQDYRRFHSIDPRATTQTNIDQANAQLRSQTAGVASAQANLAVANLVPQTIQAAEDAVKQREAQVAVAQANLEAADTNLSYTEIRAPQDGFITRRNVNLGTFLQAGQQVFYIVSPDIWVVANFKETQLADMRPGQKVEMGVDAHPNLTLHGHVGSIQQGSGARFSAFPAENATGNFVKIVRRVPVKILIDSGLKPYITLPLGLSVTPTVFVK